MIKPSRKRKQILLAITDFMLLCSSIFFTLLLRKGEIASYLSFKIHFIHFLPIIFFWLIAMYAGNFYVLEKPFDKIRTVFSLSVIASVSLLFGFTVFYLFLSDTITPKRILAIYVIVNFVLIFAWRYLYNFIYSKFKNFPKVVFVGYSKTLKNLIAEMKKLSYFNYEIAAVFDESLKDEERLEITNITVLTDIQEFSDFINCNMIDIIVFETEKNFDAAVRKKLLSLLNKNILFYSLPDFYEKTIRRIPLGSLNDIWILSEIDLSSKQLFFLYKRVSDIIIAFTILIVTAIPLIISAVAIKLESRGPIFFKQIREGKNGKLFSILKFRTMKISGNDFAPTKQNDPRITKVGNFLRKTRIDEFPQMINVLKGNMSLIGPRPERPELAVELDNNIPFYRQRLLVKPGITGWDQISGEYHSPSVSDTIKKLEYDLYYIKNISVLLDISIFFKTLTTMFSKAGM